MTYRALKLILLDAGTNSDYISRKKYYLDVTIYLREFIIQERKPQKKSENVVFYFSKKNDFFQPMTLLKTI